MSDADRQMSQSGQAGEPLAGLSGVADEIKQLLSTLAGEIEDSKHAQQKALNQIETRLTRIESEPRVERGATTEVRVVPWDLHTAEELTKSYEAVDPDFVEEPPYRAPRRRAPAPGPAAHMNALPGIDVDHADEERESARLGHRIADFTQRVKRSLADIRPQSSLTQLEERIDQFHRRIYLALEDVARRSDVQGLKRIEAHVGELGGRLGLVHTQLKRMDGIEGQLRTVIDRLSDERIGGIAARGAAEIHSVARLVAEETHARMATAGGMHEGGARYEELRSAIEASINERRAGERQAITMLETMQQAMIEVLDRIEAIEQAQRPPQVNTPPVQAPEPPAFGQFREQAATPIPSAFAPSIAARDLNEADIDNGHWSELPADLAVAGLATRAVPRDFIETPGAAALEGLVVEEADLASETDSKDSVVERMRRDFIADAQRAKLKAASSRAGGHRFDEKPPRPRFATQISAWLGAHASTGAGRILGVSPRLIVSALVIAVALNGALMIHLLRQPAAAAATASLQTSVPRDTAAPPAADPTNLEAEDAENPTFSETDPEASLPKDALIQEAPAPAQQPEAGADLSGRLGAFAAKANLASNFDGAKGDVLVALPQKSDGSGKSSPLDLPPATVGPLSLRLAASNGDPSAEFEVAARLAEGKGTEQDLGQAVKWYQRAAARGFAQAQYRLATHLERGLGTDQDVARARVWYQRAAEKGNVKAMHNLAVLSANGNQSSPDYETAVKWFTSAAERGLADSQFNLAVLHESGLGVPQSQVQAYKWYRLAAKAGDKDAEARCDTMKAELQKSDIASADEMVKAFSPKAIDAIVNDAHAAGEDWKKRASSDTNG